MIKKQKGDKGSGKGTVRNSLMLGQGVRRMKIEEMTESAEVERERVSHMNGVRGDLTRPPINTEHRKATLKPVQIYLYITHKHTQT